jgi:hypothetical protein
MQTALPIRTLLDAQDALSRGTGLQSQWKVGPLVWFLANKGEDWRLSAAFKEKGKESPDTVGDSDYVSS